MSNSDIKRKLKESNCYQWEVAELLNVSEWTFSRLLRKELPPEKKQEIFKAIEQLKGGK